MFISIECTVLFILLGRDTKKIFFHFKVIATMIIYLLLLFLHCFGGEKNNYLMKENLCGSE